VKGIIQDKLFSARWCLTIMMGLTACWCIIGEIPPRGEFWTIFGVDIVSYYYRADRLEKPKEVK